MIRPMPSASRMSAGTDSTGRPRQSTAALRRDAASVQPAAGCVRRRMRAARRPRPRRAPPSCRDPQRRVGGRVLELEQLDRPLDVGETTEAELEVRPRSPPRGSRSASTRALIRRMSRTCAAVSPSAGYRSGSMSVDERAPGSGSRRPAGPAAAPGTPRSAPSARSRCGSAARLRTSGPFLPSGRRSVSEVSGGSGPAGSNSRRSSWTTSAARRCGLLVGHLTGSRPVNEDHVGVRGVAHLAAPEAAHPDDEHVAAERRRASRRSTSRDGEPRGRRRWSPR